jgi:hypothetical protein
MNFQCDDLDRALELPELPGDALAHAETCPRCREQLDLWNEISRVAPELQQHWEEPDLWPRIRAELQAVQAPRRSMPAWRWALAAAAVLAICALLWRQWPSRQAPNRELLTEETLHEVQQAEASYVRSIGKLSALADPSLDRSLTPRAAAYREKLAFLDSAIAELKTTSESNRYNAYVQTQLAFLYQQKQRTLEDWLENAKQN